MLVWLKAGSECHTVQLGGGASFSITPREGRWEAFQLVAKRALSGAGCDYDALPHRDADQAGGYDLVLITPR